jgi:hypothetical protein
MSEQPQQVEKSQADRFAEAADAPRPSLPREFLDFLAHNKKWWLTPIILTLLLLGLIILFSGTGAAPFIYTIF